jgi:hypothetical protein
MRCYFDFLGRKALAFLYSCTTSTPYTGLYYLCIAFRSSYLREKLYKVNN